MVYNRPFNIKQESLQLNKFCVNFLKKLTIHALSENVR